MSNYPEKLRKIYDSGKSVGYLDKSSNQTNSEFQSELDQLEALDLIYVVDKALGSAFVELTPRGIEFCEQITDLSDLFD